MLEKNVGEECCSREGCRRLVGRKLEKSVAEKRL